MSDLDAASIPTLDHPSGEAFGEAFTAAISGLLTEGRDRQLTRYELALEATRHPELRQALIPNTAPVLGRLAEQLAVLGVPDAADRARDLLALVEGLLFSQLTAESLPSTDAVRRLVRRMLHAVDVPLGGPSASPPRAPGPVAARPPDVRHESRRG